MNDAHELELPVRRRSGSLSNVSGNGNGWTHLPHSPPSSLPPWLSILLVVAAALLLVCSTYTVCDHPSVCASTHKSPECLDGGIDRSFHFIPCVIHYHILRISGIVNIPFTDFRDSTMASYINSSKYEPVSPFSRINRWLYV